MTNPNEHIPETRTVAVIVPVYNAETTIGECLRSILSQATAETEVVAVDDGSTDGSGAVCDALAQTDGRLTVIHQPNGGRTAARAAGVARATATWVCFVDADDTLPPNALADLYAATDAETDIVMGNGRSLRHETRRTVPIGEFRHLAVRGEGTIGVPWGSLFRRTLATPEALLLPKDFYMGEDYIFWLRMVFATKRDVRIVYADVYNKGADTTSSSFVWSAAYAGRIHEMRKAAIPAEMHEQYMTEMISDRLTNLFSVSLFEKRQQWATSDFWRELCADMESIGYKLRPRQRLFLALPRTLRRLYSHLSNWRMQRRLRGKSSTCDGHVEV